MVLYHYTALLKKSSPKMQIHLMNSVGLETSIPTKNQKTSNEEKLEKNAFTHEHQKISNFEIRNQKFLSLLAKVIKIASKVMERLHINYQ